MERLARVPDLPGLVTSNLLRECCGSCRKCVCKTLCHMLPTIHAFTHVLNRAIGGCQLEWVLEAGKPYFIDYSAGREDDIQSEYQG